MDIQPPVSSKVISAGKLLSKISAYEARSSDLYEVYKLWCKENAEHPFSMKTFITYLKQNADVYGIEYTNKIHYQGGKVRGFMGLKIERQLFY